MYAVSKSITHPRAVLMARISLVRANPLGLYIQSISVVIAFGPEKDAINRRRHHGLSLALAAQFDWLSGRIQPAKTVGGEVRWKLIVLFEGVVYAVIFTRRADVLWIISLQHASRKERRAL